ncbi:MAG: hypothetical protein U0524_00985 [Candidatus Saccharimonadales bacterium]
MKYTAHSIEVSSQERRLMKRSTDLPPVAHEDILDLCDMAHDALVEEFENELEFFDMRREQLDDMNQAFHAAAHFARYDTFRLARMVYGLSNIALGRASQTYPHTEGSK